MSEYLDINPAALARLLSTRKMSFDDARLHDDEVEGGARMTLAQLTALAAALQMPIAHVIEQIESSADDLVHGVKISGRQTRFDRLKCVAGEPAYFYRHVMKTSADKHLMVLRTTPLFTSADQATLNGGHQAREFVYVLSGAVGVLWRSPSGVRREDVLRMGDSIFIESWVAHAFYAKEAGSQILAVDYR